jgi:hypothetical protein
MQGKKREDNPNKSIGYPYSYYFLRFQGTDRRFRASLLLEKKAEKIESRQRMWPSGWLTTLFYEQKPLFD